VVGKCLRLLKSGLATKAFELVNENHRLRWHTGCQTQPMEYGHKRLRKYGRRGFKNVNRHLCRPKHEVVDLQHSRVSSVSVKPAFNGSTNLD